jgi:hypothetical protein
MNILSFLSNKLVLLVCCLLPLFSAAQKDSTMGKFGVHLHLGVGMAYQDNSFAERFLAVNLNDAINFNSYMPAGLFGVDIEYKRFGIEIDGVGSIAGNSSSQNDVVLTTQSGIINLTYVLARFENVDLKGLVGIEGRSVSVVAQNQLPSTVAYNTLISRINFLMFSVGGDILWRMKPGPNKNIGAYLGLRMRYGRSLSNDGWNYVPFQNTNGDHLNTFLLGLLIGIGSRN